MTKTNVEAFLDFMSKPVFGIMYWEEVRLPQQPQPRRIRRARPEEIEVIEQQQLGWEDDDE